MLADVRWRYHVLGRAVVGGEGISPSGVVIGLALRGVDGETPYMRLIRWRSSYDQVSAVAALPLVRMSSIS